MACNCANKTALCLSGGCQILLSSMCVIYEGETLTYIGGNTNDSVHVLLQKIDEKFSTISSGGGSGTVTEVTATAGTGISVFVATGTTTPAITITNTAPDQTVTLTAGANVSISGTYPNFTISSSGGGITDGDKGDITVASSGASLTIDTNIVKTWTGKHTWTPNSTNSGVNVGSYAGTPSIPVTGDIWHNSTSTINDLYSIINGYGYSLTRNPSEIESAAYRLITEADRGKVIILVNINPITVEFPNGLSQDHSVVLVKGAGSGDISLTGTIEGVATTMLTDNTAVQFQHRGGGIWMAWGALGTFGGGGSGITSINGLTTGTQFFVNDTNVTVVSSGGNHTITWAGTLADGRIGSAATWNAKIGGSGTSGQLAVFNASGTITSDSGALYSSGTITTTTSLISTTVAANTLILGKDTSQTSTSYSIQTQGTQTNIDIQAVVKGHGDFNITGTSWASTLKIDDSSNDIRIYQTGSALTTPKLRIIGWGGDVTQTTGGNVEVTGGNAYGTGNTNGGSVLLKSGAKNGSGTDGNVEIDSLTGIVKLTQTPATGSSNTAVLTRDSSTGAIEVRDQNSIGMPVLNLMALSSNFNQNTTYYFGIHPNTPTTSATIRKIYFRRNVTIKHIEIYSQSVTAGSNENWSMYLRVDGTTDTLIQTVGVNTGERIWTNSSMSVDVDADHYVEIKTVTPTTWATAPVTTVISGYIAFEYR